MRVLSTMNLQLWYQVGSPCACWHQQDSNNTCDLQWFYAQPVNSDRATVTFKWPKLLALQMNCKVKKKKTRVQNWPSPTHCKTEHNLKGCLRSRDSPKTDTPPVPFSSTMLSVPIVSLYCHWIRVWFIKFHFIDSAPPHRHWCLVIGLQDIYLFVRLLREK